MENSKTYKLYKSGKLWVIGAVAVAGVAVSANTTQVSADTVSDADAQAVKTTDATQNDKQVQLTASSTDTATDKATTDDATKTATVSSTAEKSTVPTTAGTSVTQDQAKDAVDKAQDTVKSDADTASKAGVDVTTGKTTDVTINDDNASSKTNEVLSDLNKQDQAVKDATAKQKANVQAYDKATSNQKDATTKGQADLDKSTSDLDKTVDNAKQAGIDVSVEVSKTAPEYKSLKGLEGQDLLDAMAYNIDLYNKAIANGVATQNQDAQTLAKLTAEYQKQVADYQAKKAAVDKANADKKAAFDKAMQDFKNGTNNQLNLVGKTQTDQDNGTLQTFMSAKVNQDTGEFTLTHDMNNNGTIIGRGVLSGRILYEVISNGDGSETIHVTGIQLYNYVYTKIADNTNPNKNINLHVYDYNGNEIYVSAHDGGSSFTDTIDKTFALNKTFVLLPNQTSDLFEFLKIDDNWEINTHGQISAQFKNTNSQPTPPDYEQEPVAPDVPTFIAHKLTVEEMPNADKPEPQKVELHFFNIKKTPKIEHTATPKAVETASILPTTHANENQGGAWLSALAGVASLGLAFGISKKGKKQN
ncbi:KxYKxGKxW signal peptide domain-containing protein [Leuconostoc pseudomesenteroides]|uniref:KxYKxGKxW signal peptide domain-containing protein n=1 Tax=Leuconostoc pseudomesenteroides TaxID=33968 RepID=UPI00289D63C9|nr:KxYKxGKxW signal peptide domain-containing protein [Leuconostoc pseudomesenteroides]